MTSMAGNIDNSGLNPHDEARYARKLVSADLAAEQARVAAQRRQAGTPQLAAAADDRLSLIRNESRQRDALRAVLGDGTSAEAYAASLQALPELVLHQLERSLKAAGRPTAETRLRLLALQRERDRRLGATEAAAAAQEKTRLKALKRQYAALIAHLTPDQRAMEQALEAIRLDASKKWLGSAKARLAQATGGAERQRVEAEVRIAEAQVRSEYSRRAVLNAGPSRAKAPAPVEKTAPVANAHPAAGAPVWKTPGMFVWHAGAFPADIAVEKLKAQGIKWVALQITDGMTVNDETTRELQAGYIQKLHAAGIQVGFWGVNRNEPEAEARLAADQVKQWGADFYIANAEFEYKYTDPQGKPDPVAFERSKRWVDTFRKALPDLPASISSYGRADMADLDWKVWRDNGFDWLPQAYLNEFDINDPKLCVDGAVKAGWPRDRVHPTLGIWGGGQSRIVSAAEYVERLRAAGSVGFSSYLAEQTPESDWHVLGQAIAQGDLAQ